MLSECSHTLKTPNSPPLVTAVKHLKVLKTTSRATISQEVSQCRKNYKRRFDVHLITRRNKTSQINTESVE